MPEITISEVSALSTILDSLGKNVRYLSHTGDVVLEGTARHIVKSVSDYTFLSINDNMLNGYLRITLKSGADIALPIVSVMELVQAGEYVIVK